MSISSTRHVVCIFIDGICGVATRRTAPAPMCSESRKTIRNGSTKMYPLKRKVSKSGLLCFYVVHMFNGGKPITYSRPLQTGLMRLPLWTTRPFQSRLTLSLNESHVIGWSPPLYQIQALRISVTILRHATEMMAHPSPRGIRLVNYRTTRSLRIGVFYLKYHCQWGRRRPVFPLLDEMILLWTE